MTGPAVARTDCDDECLMWCGVVWCGSLINYIGGGGPLAAQSALATVYHAYQASDLETGN